MRSLHASSPTNDTSPDAADVVRQCVRALAPWERVQKACRLSQRGKRLALEALRRRHPRETDEEIRVRYIELAYGTDLAADVRRWLGERRP